MVIRAEPVGECSAVFVFVLFTFVGVNGTFCIARGFDLRGAILNGMVGVTK